MEQLLSPRLVFAPVRANNGDALHALATDPFIRKYLLDGHVVPRDWADAEISRAEALFADQGLGLYILFRRGEIGSPPAGFAGFRVFEDLGPEPQLLYALRRAATGQGFATEAGRTLLEAARAAGCREVYAAVDAPNVASVAVLERLAFRETERVPGAFGETIKMLWRAHAANRPSGTESGT